MSRAVAALALAAASLLAALPSMAADTQEGTDDAASVAAPASHVYEFQALLDDKPIGHHRFAVTVDGQSRRVVSEADFAVKFLGFQAYRYHHHAEEHWQGECLASLESSTDDDGKPASVHLERDGDTNRIRTAAGEHAEPGCLMSYAYWNPALRTQTRLLNPQTGKVDAVHIERAGTGTIQVGGQAVQATKLHIDSPDAPIDVWYSAQGEWIGLDSTVAGGKHHLSYRLP